MQFLKRIWSDVKRGESIDLYVTVVIALGLVMLNLLGVAPQTWIAPITLSVLGLLAISVLGNRHRVEELMQSLSQSASSVFLEEFPPDLETEFESAKELWLVGVTLRGTMNGKYIKVEEKLRQGHIIKVLLVHPEGASVEMAASRYYAEVNQRPERIARATLGSLQLFCSLRQVAPDKLEIRTIRNPLTFGAIAVDPGSNSGILYLEHYPFRTISSAVPKVVLKASDGHWYEFFRREIRALWNNGEVWECSEVASKQPEL
ncbi:MAG: hypothetical protein ISS50_07705 [Anaerolineae bacterium]|nr:hypothetical protein [Anaerolineae bacterium]